MTRDKAARLIAGLSAEDVVLGIMAPHALIRDHTIPMRGPLPSDIVLDVLAERIIASRRP